MWRRTISANLRMVSSFLSLLERRLSVQLDQESQEYLNFARDGAQRMDRLIVDLLEYSRVGRQSKPQTEVDLAQVIEVVLRTLSVSLEEAGGTVTIEGTMPIVLANGDELVRLLQNLIGNAIAYRDPNRVLTIVVGCRKEAAHWLIWVADNGLASIPSITSGCSACSNGCTVASGIKEPASGWPFAARSLKDLAAPSPSSRRPVPGRIPLYAALGGQVWPGRMDRYLTVTPGPPYENGKFCASVFNREADNSPDMYRIAN